MRNSLILLAVSMLFISCGSNKKKKETPEKDLPVKRQERIDPKPRNKPLLTNDQDNSNNNQHNKAENPTVDKDKINDEVDISTAPKIGENLIVNCTKSGVKFGCQLHKGYLTPKTKKQYTYTVTYSYPCNAPITVGLCTNHGCKLIKNKTQEGSITITGVGGLYLEEHRDITGSAFGLKCELKITNIEKVDS